MSDSLERLQNLLAQRGVASRRGAARLITAGRVRVDDRPVTTPGARIDPNRARILCDGQPLPPPPETRRTIALHKPPGIICSTDNRQGRTIMALGPFTADRLVPAGRLDKDSEGLVILSNDGGLILRLTHPRYGHRKTYRVWVTGALTRETLRTLRRPIEIDGTHTRPAEVRLLRRAPQGAELQFRLSEGRHRQIRRLCERAGLRVDRLVRTAIGNLSLTPLLPGAWRVLTEAECTQLGGSENA